MDFSPLLKDLNIEFSNISLLQRAFTHRSLLNEQDQAINSNERLEFLGDAVLELVATEYLFLQFEKFAEGQLTALRSALVRGKHLAQVARKLGLDKYMLLSKGEDQSGGRDKDYILANMTEALIGAIHLDQGFQVSKQFILDHIICNIDEIISNRLHIDPKTYFQEICQEIFGLTPEYKLISQSGPDHNKIFIMAVYVGTRKVAEGSDSSKQKAEQQAATLAIKVIEEKDALDPLT